MLLNMLGAQKLIYYLKYHILFLPGTLNINS